MNCSLPFKIGSNISIKNYNKLLESRELSGYKLEYNNGNVFIIDMCTQEHEGVVVLLQDYFKIPNGGVIINPPIIVSGQPRKKIQALTFYRFSNILHPFYSSSFTKCKYCTECCSISG